MEKRKRIIFIVYILYMAGYETCRIIIGRGTRDAVNRENSDVVALCQTAFLYITRTNDLI